MTDPHAKPRPTIGPDSEPFWAALREGEMRLPFCEDCGTPHLPAGPVCPFCFSDRLAWRRASGRGRVSTWTVVHKAWFPSFAAEVPYNVVQVELEEGPRLTANLVGAPNSVLRVGLPVELVLDRVADDLVMPRFRPSA